MMRWTEEDIGGAFRYIKPLNMKQVEVTEIKKLKHMGNPIKLQVSDFTLNASFVD